MLCADCYKRTILVLCIPFAAFTVHESERQEKFHLCQYSKSSKDPSQVSILTIYVHFSIIDFFLFLNKTSDYFITKTNNRNIQVCLKLNHTIYMIMIRFIAPENLPVEYGGLKRENDEDFTPAEKASELIIRGTSITHIEFPVTEVHKLFKTRNL